jgi:hypothetical protein
MKPWHHWLIAALTVVALACAFVLLPGSGGSGSPAAVPNIAPLPRSWCATAYQGLAIHIYTAEPARACELWDQSHDGSGAYWRPIPEGEGATSPTCVVGKEGNVFAIESTNSLATERAEAACGDLIHAGWVETQQP